MYSRKSADEVKPMMVEMKVDYVIVEDSWCTRRTKYVILWNHYYLWGSNFRGFRGSLKPRNTIFPLTVAFSVWNHEFKNPWINAFCRKHENWCQRIKILSQYIEFFAILVEPFYYK